MNSTKNISWISAITFWGVDGVKLILPRIFLARQFGLWFINFRKLLLEEPEVDQVNDKNYDNDAIHFGGPCTGITIIRPRVHCADDRIAINADDVLGSPWGTPGVNWACSGDSTDVEVQGMVVPIGRDGTVSWGGLCFRSTVARIDDVRVKGISGQTAAFALWAPNFNNDTYSMLIPGPGIIGTVTLEDVAIDCQSPYQGVATFGWAMNTERLCIRNRYRRNAQALPDIFVARGCVIQHLEMFKHVGYQAAGAANNTQQTAAIFGTVTNFTMTGRVFRDPSIAVAAAPLLQLGTYTAN